MADCVAIQQECIVAGRATRAKIVSQYKGDCIVTGCSWALGWGAGRCKHAQGALGARRQARQAAGLAGGSSARARSAGRQAAGARQVRGAGRGARHGRARQQAWALAGRAGWLGAVHSVHSAHFRSVLTRYFPESNFLDVVCEPGS